MSTSVRMSRYEAVPTDEYWVSDKPQWQPTVVAGDESSHGGRVIDNRPTTFVQRSQRDGGPMARETQGAPYAPTFDYVEHQSQSQRKQRDVLRSPTSGVVPLQPYMRGEGATTAMDQRISRLEDDVRQVKKMLYNLTLALEKNGVLQPSDLEKHEVPCSATRASSGCSLCAIL